MTIFMPHGDAGRMSGGHMRELVQPHVWCWPGHHRQRRVSVNIMCYSIGVHYWVSVKREANSLWNWREGYWQDPWDNPEPDEEFPLWKHYNTHQAAFSIALGVLQEHYPECEVEFNWTFESAEKYAKYYGLEMRVIKPTMRMEEGYRWPPLWWNWIRKNQGSEGQAG